MKHWGNAEQNTAVRSDPGRDPGSIRALDHALAPPAGFVEVATIPLSRATTHSVVDGQLTPKLNPSPGSVVGVHALAPPVGSAEV